MAEDCSAADLHVSLPHDTKFIDVAKDSNEVIAQQLAVSSDRISNNVSPLIAIKCQVDVGYAVAKQLDCMALLTLLSNIYVFPSFFNVLFIKSQCVITRSTLSVLSRTFTSSYRKIYTDWLTIEADPDAQAITRINITIPEVLHCFHQINFWRKTRQAAHSFESSCLPCIIWKLQSR